MAILRIQKKENNFVVLNRFFLQEKSLSWRAKGMLAYFLSLPHDWKIHVTHLIEQFPEGKHVVYATIKELKAAGYIKTSTQRNASGTFVGEEYDVFEAPQLPYSENQDTVKNGHSPHPDFRDTEKRDTDYRHPDNQPLQNSNKTKNKYNKENNTTNHVFINSSVVTDHSNPKTTVAAVSDNKDTCISTALTETQRQYVDQFVFQELIPHTLISQPQQLVQEILFALLDDACYSQAGKDFLKKFNTIKKCIRENKWRTPLAFNTTSFSAKNNKFPPEAKKYRFEIEELQREHQALKRAATESLHAGDIPYSESCHKSMGRLRIKIKALQQQLHGIPSGTPSLNHQGQVS